MKCFKELKEFIASPLYMAIYNLNQSIMCVLWWMCNVLSRIEIICTSTFKNWDSTYGVEKESSKLEENMWKESFGLWLRRRWGFYSYII